MICAECGTENPAGRKFCRECGAHLAVSCPECGTANLPDDKFCGDCGTSLGVRHEPAAEVPLEPGAVAEPQQERRFVSVLFADLVGFTPFSEGRDPEEVRDFLSDYFEKAGQIVEGFGGTVDKYIGDALMAVWGALAAQEDDAERAVRAAMELVDLVGKLGAEVGAPEVSVRVGVMTGETAVGPGGNRAGLIIGDLVNTASRLQSIAEPGTVLVGEATSQIAGKAIEFEPIGDQTLKGKALPVKAYRALRLIGMRGGYGRGEILEPPFVGRVEELRLLKDLLQVTGREKRPRLLSVIGIVGVGKSRLAWEFKKYADGLVEDIYWHEGRSPAYGEGVTFWALGEMVRRRADLTEGEDSAAARRKLQDMLEKYVSDKAEQAWLEPRLAGLLGLEEIPPGERGELFSAFRTFFERVADRGTTVLVFEDLHWADSGLLDFIEELPEWSRASPILIITLARPELLDRRPDWGSGRRDFMSMHLGPLSDSEIREMVVGIAPGIPDEVIDRVQERAAGVPLYAVELIRMLVNDGTLQLEDGGFELVGDLRDMAVPESLHAVIGARLDRLDSEERDMLQNAAVLGQTFFLEGLAALTGSPVGRLEPHCTRLVRKELLEIKRDPRSPERGQYGFVQALIREVAYGRLSRQDRRERHLQAARYYQNEGDDEVAAIVASHYLAAYQTSPPGPQADELAQSAVEALVGAAERAAALQSHQQTLALCRQAQEVLPEGADQTRILELAVTSAAASADEGLVDQYGQRLLEWQKTRGDASGYVRAGWLYGRALLDVQVPIRAMPVLEEVVSDDTDLGSDPALVSAAVELARAQMLSGQRPDAALTAERALVAAERLEMIPEIAHALITRGTALAGIGRLREGSALLRGGLHIALEHDLPLAELRARSNLGFVTLWDYPPTTAEMIPPALEKARKLGDRSFELFFAGWMIELWAAWGEFDRALALIDEYGVTGVPSSDHLFAAVAAYIRILRESDGDLGEIDEIARRAVDLDDPQTRGAIQGYRAVAYGAVGRLEESYQLSMRNYQNDEFQYEGTLRDAAQAAAWARSPERLREVEAAFESGMGRGRVVAAYKSFAQASLLALEGKTEEAATLFADLADTWQKLDLSRELADTYAALALTCPHHPDAPRAAEEFRTFYRERGATNLVDLFDRLYEGQLVGSAQ